ncbi:zinc-dependent metalloprotease [Natronoglycomyces albus]|uniref:Zinc-dependent metalloprotease n=1 Tax=Natronoglycomyces albus TaxID=2811108 RepID=A0A895XMQ9_9ACTN|nr:zinc-dependent metalloprotease [Natronoglycomyces albus]QSB05052.1 zinc-dependent metalloprotease [Natronoglycomyces albus]
MTEATTAIIPSRAAIPALDWNTALACARVLGRGGPSVPMATATAAVTELREVAAESVGMVSEYTRLECNPLVPIEVVDRYRWVEANVDGLSALLRRYEKPAEGGEGSNPITAASRLAGAQAGVVLSYVSSKVLGQLEPFATESGRLLLVAPNVVETERKLRLPTTDFRLWIAIHESTHLAQFSGVNWLRSHFLHLIDNFFAADDESDRSVSQMRRALATAADGVRGRNSSGTSLLQAVVTDEQRDALNQLQNLMTVLEGHAEATMDAVAQTHIRNLDLLRRRFDHRRHHPGPVQRLIRQLLGMDGKIQQYARGRAFVDHAIAEAGIDGFNRIWNTPDNLPTEDEIGRPQQWLQRINP